jgi:hypothetical protein
MNIPTTLWTRYQKLVILSSYRGYEISPSGTGNGTDMVRNIERIKIVVASITL